MTAVMDLLCNHIASPSDAHHCQQSGLLKRVRLAVPESTPDCLLCTETLHDVYETRAFHDAGCLVLL